MKRIFGLLLACGLLLAVSQQLAVTTATAQQGSQEQGHGQEPPDASQRALFSKIDAYVTCLNDLSATIYRSRERYFNWAPRSGPTGRESHIGGIDSSDNPAKCRDSIAMVNDVAPHHPQFEDAASAYVNAVTKLYPLTKELHLYYENDTYEDDHMARGKALHPPLLAAFDEFFAADRKLRDLIDPVNDNRAHQELASLERQTGRDLSYEFAALLIDAKTLVNALRTTPDIARITAALSQYDTSIATVSTLDEAARNNNRRGVDSFALGYAKELRADTKIFMRRLRNKTPYNIGDQLLLRGFHLTGWMARGSLPNLANSYNRMIDFTNRGTTSPSLKWIPLSPADVMVNGTGRMLKGTGTK